MNNDKPLILVVDDEADIRELIKDILEDEGYIVSIAANGEQARKVLSSQDPTLVLLDIWMPDIDGISLLREFKEQKNELTIIMMSGHGTIETAVEATKLGARDLIEKPLSMAKLLRSVEMAIENHEKKTTLYQQLFQTPVGKSPQINLLKEQSQRVSQHDMPILLFGEHGSGKHCFAHYLYSLSQYSNGKFIELTADSFLLDSFKFTTIANNNCVFINDVALLNHEAQRLLSHLLDTNKLTNCLLILATQYSLEKAIIEQSFSEALLYQINSITLSIPALRDHIEDIPELVHFFVDQQTTQAHFAYRHFTVSAQNSLRNYVWPGNVLELKNVIQRLLALGKTSDIDAVDIKQALDTENNIEDINYHLPLREAREQFERIYLLKKLQETDGNVSKAAKLAGMERTHLYRKLRSLDIDTKISLGR